MNEGIFVLVCLRKVINIGICNRIVMLVIKRIVIVFIRCLVIIVFKDLVKEMLLYLVSIL